MKTVTIKMPDELFEKVESSRKKEGKKRSHYLNDLVEKNIIELEKEELRKAAKKTAKQYENIKDELREWDNVVFDYEQHYGIDKK